MNSNATLGIDVPLRRALRTEQGLEALKTSTGLLRVRDTAGIV